MSSGQISIIVKDECYKLLINGMDQGVWMKGFIVPLQQFSPALHESRICIHARISLMLREYLIHLDK